MIIGQMIREEEKTIQRLPRADKFPHAEMVMRELLSGVVRIYKVGGLSKEQIYARLDLEMHDTQ